MYKYKDKYTLDFSKIEHYNEIHQIIKQEFDFPDYYGENWDAFWDCFSDLVCGQRALNIEILGAECLQQKYPEDLKCLLDLLKEAKHWCNDRFSDFVNIEIINGSARYEIH